MASGDDLSPRLAALCADHDEIREAALRAGILTTQELGALGTNADVVATMLRLGTAARSHFGHIFAIAKARADGADQERLGQRLDVLNAEGHLIMTRPRGDVHRQGFWHRAVNIWPICPSTLRVLVGQRAVSKDTDALRWTCACGRVSSGDLSMNTAVDCLAAEFSIRAVPDEQISLAFTLKCPRRITRGLFAGQLDGAWIDVYLMVLDQEIPVERLLLDVRAKQAAKYVSLDELERALAAKDDNYVIPTNDEYTDKLVRYLRRMCRARRAA